MAEGGRLDYDMLYEILLTEEKEAFRVEKQEFWEASFGEIHMK